MAPIHTDQKQHIALATAAALSVAVLSVAASVRTGGALSGFITFIALFAFVAIFFAVRDHLKSGHVTGTDAERVKRLLEQQKESGKLLIRRDLELSRANEQLRALDQMKSDFVTVAVHQLRTPLSAIRWTLSMLLRGDLGPLSDEQKTFLMKASESNKRMVALLSDMLLSDRLESGKMNPTTSSTLLPDLPENLLIEIRPLAEKKGVHLRFVHSDPAYAPVSIDPQHLYAVLQNLLENAVKYTRPGGDVTLEIRGGKDKTTLVVSDTGIGIPLPQQKNVFSRFFRAQNAMKMETDGSGLGLYIVKSIVERNQGTIRFESTEDKGTTFFVELPNTSAAPAIRSADTINTLTPA